MAENERFLNLYKVYEYLRDNPISASMTSKLLRRPDVIYFETRLRQELEEMNGVIIGEHSHSNNPREDFLKETNQVWYWLSVASVSRRLSYEEINPYNSLIEGLEQGYNQFPSISFSSLDKLKTSFKETMDYVGDACRIFSVSPREIAEYDLAQMKNRPYLKDILTELGFAS